MSKKQKKIKIWWIYNNDGSSYWSDTPEFTYEFKNMSDFEEFSIECRELTKREYEKLSKTSHEFEGW
jgi:Neuraminidase (sialidase)